MTPGNIINTLEASHLLSEINFIRGLFIFSLVLAVAIIILFMFANLEDRK